MIDIIGARSPLAPLASGKCSEPRSRCFVFRFARNGKEIERDHVNSRDAFSRSVIPVIILPRDYASRTSERENRLATTMILAERAFQRTIDFPIARARGAMRTFAEERARATGRRPARYFRGARGGTRGYAPMIGDCVSDKEARA